MFYFLISKNKISLLEESNAKVPRDFPECRFKSSSSKLAHCMVHLTDA